MITVLTIEKCLEVPDAVISVLRLIFAFIAGIADVVLGES